jgi:acylphosphatase
MASSRRESAWRSAIEQQNPIQADRKTEQLFMERQRLRVLYSGHVQGVGFRYSVKSLAPGFEVTGTIRNLPDGRVELQAEGEKEELRAFQQAIRDSGLGGLIKQEQESWSQASNEFRGFTIVG